MYQLDDVNWYIITLNMVNSVFYYFNFESKLIKKKKRIDCDNCILLFIK